MKAQNPELWAAQRILDLLEQGGLPPWRKPWKGCAMPQNMTSRREYNGLNRWMLLMAPYGSPFYITIKQINALGGKIIKGEKPWPVFFWQRIEKELKDGSTRNYLFCRGYKVWNVEQCEGLPEDKIPDLEAELHEHDTIAECEAIVQGYEGAPEIIPDIGRCYYAPLTDKVGMVPIEHFDTAEHYYSALFHEFAHSTGHGSRLDREGLTKLVGEGSHEYSQEELVAEFCSAMLCAQAGIDQEVIENQAAYIAGWHKRLRGDPEALVFASRDANKAFNHIVGKTYETEE